MKLKTKLWVLLPLAVVVTYCEGNKVTVPDSEKLVIDPSNRIGEISVLAPPTPDPTSAKSYITFSDGCAGVWCAVKGSANRVSIIATIPMKNDAKSIYGEWFVDAETGKCVVFPRAEQFIKFPGCGDIPVQCDASLSYIGGAHAGHIFTTVRATSNCPDPTPTPSPTPTPTPSPTPTPTPTPSPNPGLCYYRVSCGEQSTILSRECTDQAQQSLCEAKTGLAGFKGIWMNFGAAQLRNHCKFIVPGVIDADFQLNPGQSDHACLNKND